MNMNPNMLDAAIAYAERGCFVLPLHTPTHCGCSCGNPACARVGKHPRTPHGVNDATNDENKIRDYWSQWPTANIGIATGTKSNLAVIDIDNENAFNYVFALLEKSVAAGASSLEGLEMLTTGRGFHLYFRCPGTQVRSTTLRQGLELKGDGAYVVAPPSLHSSGRRYSSEARNIPDPLTLPLLPDCILRLQRQEQPLPTRVPPGTVIQHGSRNVTMASLAGTMRNRGMSREAIEAALLAENRIRCAPPLSEDDVKAIAESYGKYPAGDAARTNRLDAGAIQIEVALPFRTLSEVSRDVPSRPIWIAAPWIVAGSITELDGKVKSAGKTTFLTHLCSAVVDGIPFMGYPTRKTPIVYLSEQPPVSFMEAAKLAGLVRKQNFHVLFWRDTVGVSWQQTVSAAVKECKRLKAKLLIIDTIGQFTELSGDTENNAGDALEAMRPLQLAATDGLAIVIVRHERKSGGEVGVAGRGSSAYPGAVDVVLSIRRPDGAARPSLRVIHARSRFPQVPDELMIELTAEGYKSLGSVKKVAAHEAEAAILAAVPTGKAAALTLDEMKKDRSVARSTAQRVLESLSAQGVVVRRGLGKKNDPYRYYRKN